MATKTVLTLDQYPFHHPIPVRFNDYNIAHHVDNTVFYVFFEEAVVNFLRKLGLQWRTDDVPFVAESQCAFLRPIEFHTDIIAGIGVQRAGKSSLTYGIGLFEKENAHSPVGQGALVHVFVDRENHRPSAIPPKIRDAVDHNMIMT